MGGLTLGAGFGDRRGLLLGGGGFLDRALLLGSANGSPIDDSVQCSNQWMPNAGALR